MKDWLKGMFERIAFNEAKRLCLTVSDEKIDELLERLHEFEEVNKATKDRPAILYCSPRAWDDQEKRGWLKEADARIKLEVSKLKV